MPISTCVIKISERRVLPEQKSMIGIIDYGVCNVGSVQNMFHRSGILAEICNESKNLNKFSKIVLPGVGHFGRAMDNLRNYDWIEPLSDFVRNEKKPLLGICLGMQLLCSHSEEGDCEGLGLIKGKVTRFDQASFDDNLRIPHMGWAEVYADAPHPLILDDQTDRSRFYFVHSLHVQDPDETTDFDAILRCSYGYSFVAALAKDNLIGVQFHPEKSHKFGVELLRRFSIL